ncbi:hypothetical protein KKF05_05170 [Patescibacteria group bacterium]|nr:hypothetical protein [Patescibacteria group bacterium]MBU1916230.1 hypothetical protein [Patescibacteria group bacterium]
MTWVLLAILLVLAIRAIWHYRLANRDYHQLLTTLRFRLELLDILREAELVLENVRQDDFNSEAHLRLLRERLEHLLERIVFLEQHYLSALSVDLPEQDKVLEKQLTVANQTLSEILDRIRAAGSKLDSLPPE